MVKIHKCLGRHPEPCWPLPCMPIRSLEAVSPSLLSLLPWHCLQCSSYSRLVRYAAGTLRDLYIATGMSPVGQLSDIPHNPLHAHFSAGVCFSGNLAVSATCYMWADRLGKGSQSQMMMPEDRGLGRSFSDHFTNLRVLQQPWQWLHVWVLHLPQLLFRAGSKLLTILLPCGAPSEERLHSWITMVSGVVRGKGEGGPPPSSW